MTSNAGPAFTQFGVQRLEFTKTFEEYAEANRAHFTGGQQLKLGRGLFGWVLFVALAILLFSLLNKRTPPPPASTVPAVTSTTTPLLNAFLPMVPWLVIFVVIWFFVFRARVKGTTARSTPSFLYASQAEADALRLKHSRTGRSKFSWIFLILILFVGLVFAVAFLNPRSEMQDQPQQPVGAENSLLNALLPLIPWLLIFGFIWFFIIRSLRGKGGIVRQTWEAHPNMQQPVVYEVTEIGTTSIDAVTTANHTWDAYIRVIESPNLFLLYTGQISMDIIPKRAFASPEAVSAFRELLRVKIANRPAPAFPVVMTLVPNH